MFKFRFKFWFKFKNKKITIYSWRGNPRHRTKFKNQYIKKPGGKMAGKLPGVPKAKEDRD